MITSELRITGHNGGNLEYAHDGNDLENDKKMIYSMLFMAMKNFHDANPNCVLDHRVIMDRQVRKILTQEDWVQETAKCKDCTEAETPLCAIHDQISELINLATLPSESV